MRHRSPRAGAERAPKQTVGAAACRAIRRWLDEAALQELLDRGIGPEAKDTVMTVAQRYIEKGRQEGRKEILLRQLRKRFGAAVDASVESRVTEATGAEIEAWSDRVLSAATLDEIFAG